MKSGYRWCGRLLGSLLSVMAVNIVNAQQETSEGRIQWADPNIRGDGTMTPMGAATQRGPTSGRAARRS